MRRLLSTLFLLALVIPLSAQQVADPNFDPKVAHPAYAQNDPKVLFCGTEQNAFRYEPSGHRQPSVRTESYALVVGLAEMKWKTNRTVLTSASDHA